MAPAILLALGFQGPSEVIGAAGTRYFEPDGVVFLRPSLPSPVLSTADGAWPSECAHRTMSSMSIRLVSLMSRIFKLLAFAGPRAAGIMLSSRAASAAINGAYSPVTSFA
jgi:hypothetical protein